MHRTGDAAHTVFSFMLLFLSLANAAPPWDIIAGGLASDATLYETSPGVYRGSVILTMQPSTVDPDPLLLFKSYIVPVSSGTSCTEDPTVFSGATPGPQQPTQDNGSTGTANMWIVEITDLAPNTQYCFAFEQYGTTRAAIGMFTMPPVVGDVKLVVIGDSDVYRPPSGIIGLGRGYAASLTHETRTAHSLFHEGDLFYKPSGANVTYSMFSDAHRHMREMLQQTETAVSVIFDNHDFDMYWRDNRSYGKCAKYTEAFNAAYDHWKFTSPGHTRGLYVDIPYVHKPQNACENFTVSPTPSLTRHLDFGAVDMFILDQNRDGVAGLNNQAWITRHLRTSARNPNKRVRVVLSQSRRTYTAFIRKQIATGAIPDIAISLVLLGGEFHDGMVINTEEGATILQTPGFAVSTNAFHNPAQTAGLTYTTGENSWLHGYNVILYNATANRLTVQVKKLDPTGGPGSLLHQEHRSLDTAKLRVIAPNQMPWSIRGSLRMAGQGSDTIRVPVGQYDLYADGALYATGLTIHPSPALQTVSVVPAIERTPVFNHSMHSLDVHVVSDMPSSVTHEPTEGRLKLTTEPFHRTIVLDPISRMSDLDFAVEMEVVVPPTYLGGGEVGLVLCADEGTQRYVLAGFSPALSNAYIKRVDSGNTTILISAPIVGGLGVDTDFAIYRGALPTLTAYVRAGVLSLALNGVPVPGLTYTLSSAGNFCQPMGYMGGYGEATVSVKNTSTKKPGVQELYMYALRMGTYPPGPPSPTRLVTNCGAVFPANLGILRLPFLFFLLFLFGPL